MTGAPHLPTQEYCDDFQTKLIGPIAATDMPLGGIIALWFPDRPVAIDSVRMWSVGGTAFTTGTVQLIRGIHPLGDTGADADIAAVGTAARILADATAVPTTLDTEAEFAITENTAGNRAENFLDGAVHEVVPGDGSAVRDFLAMEETVGLANGTTLYVEVRYRSKIN
jgi:hypothetical protein